MPVIPALREAKTSRYICEFEASLVYRVSSRTARDTQRNPVSKKKKSERKKRKRKGGRKERERKGAVKQKCRGTRMPRFLNTLQLSPDRRGCGQQGEVQAILTLI